MPLREALIARLEAFIGVPMRPFRPAPTAEVDCYGTIAGDA
jgi:hypothetical protein